MASGDTLCSWPTAYSMVQPSTGYTAMARDIRNNVGVLDADAAAVEVVILEGVLPANYAGGGLTFNFWFKATTATTGDVVTGAAIERGNTDIDSDSFASEKTVTSTTDGTCGISKKGTISYTSGAEMDSLAAGEPFRIKLARNGSDGSDTMAGDAEYHAAELKET